MEGHGDAFFRGTLDTLSRGMTHFCAGVVVCGIVEFFFDATKILHEKNSTPCSTLSGIDTLKIARFTVRYDNRHVNRS